LVDRGKKNKTFLRDIKQADDDEPPGFFADTAEQAFFGAVYYGWLIGRYGKQWDNHIYDNE